MGELVDRLLAIGAARVLAPGEVLVREGDMSADVYVVRRGALRVSTAGGVSAVSGPGEIVGELAAVTGGARTATLSALEETEIAVLPAAVFESELAFFPEEAAALTAEATRRLDRTTLVNILTAVSGPLSPDVAAEIEEAAEWVRLRAGETLFREGEPSDAAYIVLSGRLAVERSAPDGALELLGDVGPGGFVGELGIIDSAPRIAGVRARRDSTVVRLGREAFERLLGRHPAVMVSVGRAVLGRAARMPAVPGSFTVALAGADLTFRRTFAAESGRFGPVAMLDSASVDDALGKEGISQCRSGDLGEYRLVELLHTTERAMGTVIYVLDDDVSSPWSERALAHADAVVEVGGPLAVTLPSGSPLSRWVVLPVGASSAAAPTGSTVLHVSDESDVRRAARTVIGKATGLVLSGGGARGFAHLGVYRALVELGVDVDMVAGSSIGSVMAAAIAFGIPVDDLVAVAARQFRGLLDYTVPVVSLVKGERITASIAETFGETDIADLRLPFVCVSTNLTRSRIEVHRTGPVARALRASVAIPGVIPPVPEGDDLLVDGGVLDNLPVDTLRTSFSPGTIVAVDVAPNVGPRADHDFGLSVSGWKALRSRMMGRAGYPGTVALILRSMITASMRERDRQVAGGAVDLYLDLDLRGVGMLDFESVEPVARRGYEAARPRIEAWIAGR